MSREERRRQLLGIGLRKLVERPIQDLSIDEVAAEAGISRGLLFHYFPTKNDFHAAVLAAAGRRVLRNVSPDSGVAGRVAVRQVIERFLLQVDRRRESYLALVHGHSRPVGDLATTLRSAMADRVVDLMDLPAGTRPVVHAWLAYLEDRAVLWSAEPQGQRSLPLGDLVEHCTLALEALLRVGPQARDDARGTQPEAHDASG